MEKSKACIHCGNYACLVLYGARICPQCYVRSVTTFIETTNRANAPQPGLFDGEINSIDVQ